MKKTSCVGRSVCLLLCLLLLAGCGSTDSWPVNTSELAQTSYSLRSLSLDQLGAEVLLNAVPADDGVQLITLVSSEPSQCELVLLDKTLAVRGRQDINVRQEALVLNTSGTVELVRGQEGALVGSHGVNLYTAAWSIDGALYVCTQDGLSRDGTDITMPKGNTCYLQGLLSLDNAAYVVVNQYTSSGTWKKSWLCPLTPDTTELTDDGIPVPFRVDACTSDGDSGWLLSGGVLYEASNNQFTASVDLTSAGVDVSSVQKILAVEDGFLLICRNELVLLTEGEPSNEPVEKQTIRVGSTAPSQPEAVAEFNRNNERYTIEYTNYSDEAQLNLALLSGDVDLVIVSNYLLIWNYAKKGLLAPLEETAPDLFDEGVLLDNVVEALRIDGTCYFLPPTFRFESFSLPVADAREFTGLDDFLDMVETVYPPDYDNPFHALWYALRTYGDMWLDLEKWRSHFDDPSFARFLEYCNTLKAADNGTDQGRPAFAFQLTDAAADYSPEYMEEMGIVDYVPAAIPYGDWGGISLSSYELTGIVSGGNEEGAAEFLRYFIQESTFSYDAQYFISTGRFEAELEAGWDTPVGHIGYTDYQKQGIYALLKRADHFNAFYYPLLGSVTNEADVYFHGDCTLEEAVRRIQNIVTIYLAEQE